MRLAVLLIVPLVLSAIPSPVKAADCSLQPLVDAAAPGSTVKLPACDYRETVTINKPIVLDGQNQASIRGSDVWSNWTQNSNTWRSADVVPPFSTNNQGVCDAQHPSCNAPEQVFIDGKPSSFTLDAQRHVVLSQNPSGHTVEVTTRERWIDTESDDVTIENMRFWHAANPAETGAVGNQSRNYWTLRNSKLYYAHGGIVSLGGGNVAYVIGNDIAGSGYEGINGYKESHATIQGNSIRDNNLSGFDSQNWAGAGAKIVSFNDAVLTNNEVYDNLGPGLWCDIACYNVTITNNHVHDNHGAGIMFEISTQSLIQGNVVWNNQDPQVYVSSSARATVTNNTVKGAIQVWDAHRSDEPLSGVVGVSVMDNLVDKIVVGGGATIVSNWNLTTGYGSVP